MRYILVFWGLPMGLFWGWFALSYHDMHFGMLFLSRAVHDYAFAVYGHILGIDPSTIPPLVAKACVVDTAIIFGIFGFRRRREIGDWVRAQREAFSGDRRPSGLPEAGRAPPAE